MDVKDRELDALLERTGRAWAEETAGAMNGGLTASVRRRIAERRTAFAGRRDGRFAAVREAIAPERPGPIRRPALRLWLPWGGVAAAAVAVVAVLALTWRAAAPVGTVMLGEGSFAAAGARALHPGMTLACADDGRGVFLLDGDRINVYMNSGASVRVESRTAIRLERGEIWTSVEPDSGLFEVLTPFGRVEVHGTSFGVSVSEAGAEVTIASGRVEVGIGDQRQIMEPGRKALLSPGASAPRFSPAPGDVTPAWAIDLFRKASAANASLYLPSGALPGK
ncbi:MAG: hypothetical protein Kow0059_19160 [Candidatus Sumerlaeia bacterium]